MSLTRVEITEGTKGIATDVASSYCTYMCTNTNLVCVEAFWACSVHALSTEAEEVMGLLLGDVLVRPLIHNCQSQELICVQDGRLNCVHDHRPTGHPYWLLTHLVRLPLQFLTAALLPNATLNEMSFPGQVGVLLIILRE